MNSNRRSRINYQQRFEGYLNQYRRRVRFKSIATAFASVVFAAVALTLLAATLGDSLAYSNWLYYPVRILLVVSAIALVVTLLWLPFRRMSKGSGAAELENSVPAFSGRVETYIDMRQRNINSPFVGLLAKDASRTAARAPVRRLVPTGDLIGPIVGAVAMIGMAGWLFTTMPLEWRAGIKHLWLGWFQSDILPTRTVAVEPGDTKIKIGDSLFVTATVEGFESDLAELHVKNLSADDWDTVDMNRQADGSFSFTLYGVSEAMEYYVTSAFTNSERSSVEVVVPARVENIQLSYVFPEWTGLEPQTVKSGTDISAVAESTVDLLITTDKPLANGELILNDTALTLEQTNELQYSASIVVNSDGKYRLADKLGDDRIMLTPEYAITITEDLQPTISFTRPGGDYSATAIEEVTVSAKAADDFAIEQVILKYSVNGGEWQSKQLSADDNLSHTFMLEEFENETGGPLLAGDLVSYYAEASDREQSVSTDMLFIDVRPFERRFSQSQQSQQGGGGGQQQQEQEISQRQKEILVATWNLIRDQQKGENAQISPQDSATLLSDLQNTLADQAETLAERAEARQLLNNDPDIAKFVEYMQEASDSMRPSADNLASLSFNEAVTHQQRALQYLKRAESIFNDITVSQNQSEGNGSGNAGRDMAEMYELEMDLAKNQYETPDTARKSGDNDQSVDDAFDKLRDLARRQQALADAAAAKDELSMAERWQQEKLRRELEELKRELEQLQREQSASNQQSQSQQSSSQGQGNQNENQSQNDSQSAQSQGGEQGGGSSATQEAMRRIEEALEELQNSTDGNPDTSPQDLQQALNNASERLQQSLDEVSKARQQALQQSLSETTDSLRDLNRQQQETSEKLRDAMQQAMQARTENRFDSGLTPEEQDRLAGQKRAMQRQLEDIQQDIADAGKRFSEQAPQTSERLQQALDEIERNKTAELMGISGDLIDEGMAPQAALREERITQALRNLQTDLLDAQELASAESAEGPPDTTTAADAARTLQQLRQALAEALQNSAENGNQGSQELEQLTRASGQGNNSSDRNEQQQQGSEQSPGQQQGQSGQRGEAQQQGEGQGQNPGNGEQSSQTLVQGDARSGNGNATSWGSNNGVQNAEDQIINNGQTQLIEETTRQLEQITNAPIEGLSAETMADMRDLARQLSPGNSDENARRIDAEVRLLLRQLEQLELQIYSETQQANGVRSAKRVADPQGYDQRTADYFRRLSDELSGS